MERTELTADDYEYLLPDHWVIHLNNPDAPFTKLHGYYVRRVVEIMKQFGARSVLEVGCGDGWNVGQMVAGGLEVVGTDWSRNGIAHARNMVADAEFYWGDIRTTEFAERYPEKFDAVALIEVIEHIPPNDTVEALQNIISPLREGGLFVLTTPSVNYPNTNTQHYRHFTADLLQEIISEAGGLEIISIEGYGNVEGDRDYWKKLRLFDNRLFAIKPLANRVRDALSYDGPTSLDKCHGLILTARRVAQS